MDNFEYEAPMYVNFGDNDAFTGDDGADKFFENEEHASETSEECGSFISLPGEARTPFSNVDMPKNFEVNVVLSQAMKNLCTALKHGKSDGPRRKLRTAINRMRNSSYEAEDVYHRKRDQTVASKKFVSVAEAVRQFQVGTPERFHSKPKLSRPNAGSHRRRSFSAPSNTIPVTPKLSSHLRSRPIHYLTREEEEAKEAEEMKAFQIKANPLNPKVLDPPKMAVKVGKKPPTQIVPFNLTEVKKKKPETPQTFTFVARPAPTKIFEKTQGVPQKKEMPLTDPVSPGYIKRAKVFATALEVKDGMMCVVEKEVHHFGVPIAGNQERKRRTEVKPFSFEERDKQLLKRREEAAQRLLEQEKKDRVFHAKPVPHCMKSPLHQKDLPILATQPVPFNLTIDKRGENKQEQLKKKLAEEAKQLQQMALFKARPATVILKKPFEPKKSDRPLTDITAVALNTEKRAKEREEFDHKVKLEQEQLEELRRQDAEERQRQEEEEVARLRKEAVHKAKPVPKYKPLELLASDKPLTSPKTPSFVNRSRLNHIV